MANLHIDLFDAYHYTAQTKHKNSITTNTNAPGRLGWNGLERNLRQGYNLYAKTAALTCPISLYAHYADIFEKGTTKLLSWRIYISIDFMLTTPILSRTIGQVGLNDI